MTAEIMMATKVPNPVDKHVGSRVRMRRLMLGMSAGKTREQTRNILPASAEIRKRHKPDKREPTAGDVRLFKVPVPFFFDGSPQIEGRVGKGPRAASPAYVSEFLASSDGLKLAEAFTQIGDAKLRRSLVRLVEEIGGEH